METIISNKRNVNETVPDKTIVTNREIQIKRGGAIAACIAVLAMGGALFSLNNNIHRTVPNSDRESSVTKDIESSAFKENDTADPEDNPVSTARTVQDWAKSYLEQNADTVGFLKLKDLADNGDFESPVVQGEDNVFYLNHGFDKKENETGTVFADYNDPINEKCQPSNIVLFGYYTDDTDAILSSPILKYKDSKYFEQHNTIEFSTIFDDPETEYQVISCFSYDAVGEDKRDYSFRPRNFDEEKSFDEWISIVKNRAINKSDIECSEDDDYLTLVTKDSANGEDGRFAVVAKKVTETSDEKSAKIEDSLKESAKDANVKDNKADTKNTGNYTIPNDDTATDNKTEDKPENTSSKDTKKDSVIAKLCEKYPRGVYTGYQQINDDRYLIILFDLDLEKDQKNNKYIIYDASTDSEITTITTDMVNPYVFANKIAAYNYDYTKSRANPTLLATVYDENGNVLYEYEVDTYISKEYITNDISPVFNNDGSRMFYSMKKNNGDYYTDTEIFYIDSGDNTPHLLNKDSLKDREIRSWSANDDAIIIESFDDVGIISTDPDCKDNVALFDITQAEPFSFSSCGSWANGSFYYYTYSGNLTIIAPDDNGDIQVGNKHYTIKTYDFSDYHTSFAMSYNGKYFVASYEDYTNYPDDDKYFTLYEIGKDHITEIKTVKYNITKTEYNITHYGGYFDESTGIFTLCHERSDPESNTGTEYYIYDIINFFE
ncbi:class B sortase [Ruminococcus albus]|uniref:Sortase, SrtB family n=1 Tax=Ruminococcus albus TaxID=1264 RepID=A0A1H7GRW0_RUMAL|nr:class B sortase [Ruminococcus albus]SEK40247.1 sortase, SrtB family [Ruminococcus albus]